MRKWMIIEIKNISLSLKEREGLAGPSRAKAQCDCHHQWCRSWYLLLLTQCCWTHSFWDFLAKIYNLNFNIGKHESKPKLETELLDNSLHSFSCQGHRQWKIQGSLQAGEDWEVPKQQVESTGICRWVSRGVVHFRITSCFSWLLHAYVRCSHLGKLGKWHTGNLCTIFCNFFCVSEIISK